MLIQCFRRIKLTKPLFVEQDIDKSNVYANYCTIKKMYRSNNIARPQKQDD